ncbi:MAG: hypothetical protein R3B70_47980 [Polyangiaceae bacterium]
MQPEHLLARSPHDRSRDTRALGERARDEQQRSVQEILVRDRCFEGGDEDCLQLSGDGPCHLRDGQQQGLSPAWLSQVLADLIDSVGGSARDLTGDEILLEREVGEAEQALSARKEKAALAADGVDERVDLDTEAAGELLGVLSAPPGERQGDVLVQLALGGEAGGAVLVKPESNGAEDVDDLVNRETARSPGVDEGANGVFVELDTQAREATLAAVKEGEQRQEEGIDCELADSRVLDGGPERGSLVGGAALLLGERERGAAPVLDS